MSCPPLESVGGILKGEEVKEENWDERGKWKEKRERGKRRKRKRKGREMKKKR